MHMSQAEVSTQQKPIQKIKPFFPWRLNTISESLSDFNRLLAKRYKLAKKIHIRGFEEEEIKTLRMFNMRGATNAVNSNRHGKILFHSKKACIMIENIKYCCSLSIKNGYGRATDKWMLKIVKRLSNVTSLKLENYSNKAGIKQKNECLHYLKRLKNLQIIEKENLETNFRTTEPFKKIGFSEYQSFLKKLNAFRFQTLDLDDTVNTKNRICSNELQKLEIKMRSLKSYRTRVCISPYNYVSFEYLAQKLNGCPEKISLSSPGFNITWETILGSYKDLKNSSYFAHILKLNDEYASDILVRDIEFLQRNLERMTLLDMLKHISTSGVQNLKIALMKEFQLGQPLVFFDIWEILPTCHNLISLDIRLPFLSKKSFSEFLNMIKSMKPPKLQISIDISQTYYYHKLGDKTSPLDVTPEIKNLFQQADRYQTVTLDWEYSPINISFFIESIIYSQFIFCKSFSCAKKENESEFFASYNYKVLIPQNLINFVKVAKGHVNVNVKVVYPKLEESEMSLCLEKIMERFLSEKIIKHKSQFKTSFGKSRIQNEALITLSLN